MKKTETKIDKCEIGDLLEINKEFEDLMNDLQLVPNVAAVFCNKKLLNHVKELTKLQNGAILSYDTTYDTGDFYLSILICRHRGFIGEPEIPIGYLVHRKRDTESHELFFRRIKALFPCIYSANIIIVTDREMGIKNAISSTLPNAVNLFC